MWMNLLDPLVGEASADTPVRETILYATSRLIQTYRFGNAKQQTFSFKLESPRNFKSDPAQRNNRCTH
jgi:hypothetical protein